MRSRIHRLPGAGLGRPRAKAEVRRPADQSHPVRPDRLATEARLGHPAREVPRKTLPARAARAAAEAKSTGLSAHAHISARLHDLFNALGDSFPLSVVLHFELLAHTLQHALAHLGRIEVPLQGTVLRTEISRAEEQPGRRPKRADND